ncbi:MAG: hypothetical protein LBM93_15060 [Oscillospiraceae bacterium]|jgi:hypothetical protein|nr:hypothetical protein [Oscillospiraceae bacterium]
MRKFWNRFNLLKLNGDNDKNRKVVDSMRQVYKITGNEPNILEKIKSQELSIWDDKFILIDTDGSLWKIATELVYTSPTSGGERLTMATEKNRPPCNAMFVLTKGTVGAFGSDDTRTYFLLNKKEAMTKYPEAFSKIDEAVKYFNADYRFL